MTFDDDMILLETLSGPRRYMCKGINLEWPPPEKLNLAGFIWVRKSISHLSDEDRASMTHVHRGAKYVIDK